jgi:hypothetical protein
MDVTFELHDQIFEWDPKKSATNLRKHRISFERACEVFFDPFVRVVDASDDKESRDAAIGLTEDWNLLYVVHIVHHENIIRIISARLATPSERRDYENE